MKLKSWSDFIITVCIQVNDERTPPQGHFPFSGGPTETAGIYGEDSDSDEENKISASGYATPVSAGIQINSTGIPEITNSVYRESESDELLPTNTNHHYHVLEVSEFSWFLGLDKLG